MDLGTTNSVVAIMEGGKQTVIINSDGARLTPSCDQMADYIPTPEHGALGTQNWLGLLL
jgi:hypothetical protein